MFESRRRRGEFGCEPPEMAAKSLDLNTALIFFGYFFASRQKSNDAKINFKSLIISDFCIRLKII
jgi:hypothetical protein